jgi:hypothetical protein
MGSEADFEVQVFFFALQNLRIFCISSVNLTRLTPKFANLGKKSPEFSSEKKKKKKKKKEQKEKEETPCF